MLPTIFQVNTLDKTDVFYKIVRNATLNGTWVNMPDSNAFTQYNVTASGELTGGTSIDSGFIHAQSGSPGVRVDADTVYQLGRSSMGTVSDTFTIAAAAVANTKDAIAFLTWIEQR